MSQFRGFSAGAGLNDLVVSPPPTNRRATSTVPSPQQTVNDTDAHPISFVASVLTATQNLVDVAAQTIIGQSIDTLPDYWQDRFEENPFGTLIDFVVGRTETMHLVDDTISDVGQFLSSIWGSELVSVIPTYQTSTPSTPPIDSITGTPVPSLDDGFAETALGSVVTITVGNYGIKLDAGTGEILDECLLADEIIYSSSEERRCRGTHLGLGTLIDTIRIITHNHLPIPNLPDNPNSYDIQISLSNENIEWIEFRGQEGYIHIPLQLWLTQTNSTDQLTILSLPSTSDSSRLGVPATLLPDEFNTAQDVFDNFNGNVVYYTYDTELEPNIVVFGTFNDILHSQLGINESTLVDLQSNDGIFITQKSPSAEPNSGDSGGGAFIRIENDIYYLGVLNAVAFESPNSLTTPIPDFSRAVQLFIAFLEP